MNQNMQPIPPTAPAKKRKGLKITLLIIALLLVIALALLLLQQCGIISFNFGQEQEQQGSTVGGTIQQGTPGMTMEEILAALQAEADASRIRIKINARPEFESGDAIGSIYIVNSAENAFNMWVNIYLEETGELIYQSGMMPPNSYIDGDKLLVKLPAGEYAATADILAYELEDETKLDTRASASLIITIQN